MARKASSSSCFKYLFPSYYLRRPRRLGFLSLVFVILFFFFMDRQNQAREIQALGSRIEELEGEKSSLSAEIATLRTSKDHMVSTSAQGAKTGFSAQEGTKSDPLILGVGVGTRGVRKLLPKKEEASSAGAIQQVTQQQAQDQQQQQNLQQTQEQAQAQAQAQEIEKKQREQQAQDNQQQQGFIEQGGGVSTGGLEKSRLTVEQVAQSQGVTAQQEQQVQLSDGDRLAEERRESVRKGMEHAWGAYVKYAWGEDELQPVTRDGVSNFGRMGATIVDSLDTLFIMGLTEQFNKARQWVASELSFDKDYTCSVFETTIRVMGGLLSAYDLSGDAMFLQKAQDLAEKLLPAWNTESGVPWHYLNLRTGEGNSPGWAGGNTVLADAGTTQVEMIALSQRTNDSRYALKSEGVIRVIDKHFPEDGLCPIYLSPHTGEFSGAHITFGAMGDSFYEYLLKVWVQGGKTPVVKRYREMWEISIRGMLNKLVRHTQDNKITYVAEMNGGGIVSKMDHLLCFTPGMLALGAKDADEELAQEYMSLAKDLTKTCYEFYESQPSKLSGENYHFHSGMAVGQTYNIGRPETVEALFYLWRTTKDPIYREWGWNIWQAFERNCKLESGYTGLRDVSMDPPPKDNMMQSFFLAETLKYLYLLFSPDDVIPLDQWVFNTEAHPVRIIPRHQPF